MHFKDCRRAVGSLAGFVSLLDGDVNYPAVMEAFRGIGYDGWCGGELGVTAHYPEVTLAYASAAMDKIFGKGE